MSYWDHHKFAVGVDPGFGCTGVVVISKSGIEGWDALVSDSKLPLEQRMALVMNAVSMRRWDVGRDKDQGEVFALETNHVTGGRSAQSALKQRELIGVLATNAWHQGADIVRIAPTSAKKALTGSGKAPKEDMVEAMYEYEGAPLGLSRAKREAVADALVVAIAGVEKWEADHSG